MQMSAHRHHTQCWGELVLSVGSQVLQEKGQALNRELQAWQPHSDSLEKCVCCQVAFQSHQAATVPLLIVSPANSEHPPWVKKHPYANGITASCIFNY